MYARSRFIAVALLGALLAGCGTSHVGVPERADFQLKLYAVPAAQSQAIAGKLDGILASPEFLVGTKAHSAMRATAPFPGTVLVLAPASVQPSIGTAVAELAKAAEKGSASTGGAAGAPAEVPLRVQFWVVQAKAGAGDDAAALQPLEPALARVRASLGAAHFVLEDSAVVAVTAPGAANATLGNASIITSGGREFALHATTTDRGAIDLSLTYTNTTREAASQAIPELRTQLSVQPDTYVVLAEAPPAAAPANGAGAARMNLLVVRVDRIDAAAH